ncbi:RNHCP domain-containing protein [Streptomyces sp. NPDC012769]|uniref:RNHCP domain-containing protein n=1 Tax=Streptomyces sp. NPDC012769 TaxID=3364848 RepID=UPI0036BED515
MSHTTSHDPLSNHRYTDTEPSAGDFACGWCGAVASAYPPDGGRRGHCPSCLHARHDTPSCDARMTPIAVAVPRDGDWRVIHRCVRCDALSDRPVNGDDNQLVVMRMAVRPLAQPPFPLEAFAFAVGAV